MNRATLIGRLGKDPEIKTTQGGSRVVSFSIATSERWRDKNTGERKEKSEWHNIVIWNEGIGKVAEQYLKKGSLCLIEGKIETRKWQDRDGNDRYTTEIVVPQYGGYLELLGGKQDSDGGSDRPPRENRQPASSATSGRLASQLDDDIPFAPEWR